MSAEQKPAKVREPVPHLKTLDSWRGLGAMIVILHHYPGGGYLQMNGFVQNAMPLVDFFFVLSGFVIAAHYLNRINNGTELGRFMWLRVGRIYPLHLAIFLAFFAFELIKAGANYYSSGGFGDAFTGDKTIPMAIANVFAVHSLGLFHDVSWNRPAWSISCEMAAYVIFAGLTLMGGRKWRNLLYLLSGVISLIVLLLFSNHYFISTAEFGVFRCVAGFMSGVLCFQVWDAVRTESMWTRLPDWVWSVLEVGSFIFMVWWLATAGLSIGSFLAPFFFFWFVFLFSFQRGIMSKLMQWKHFVYLGLISYSIYMVHQFVFDRALNVAKFAESLTGWQLTRIGEEGYLILGSSPLMADLLFIPLAIIVILVSHFTFYAIEARYRDMAKNHLKRRKAKREAKARKEPLPTDDPLIAPGAPGRTGS